MRRYSVLLIVITLALASFTGFLNLGTMNAQGTDVGGIIGADTTWNILGSPYTVVGNIIVKNGATLTIDPSVTVKFDDYYSMYIDGNLTAVGLSTSKIQMTSNKVAVEPGDWDRIQVNSTGHAEIINCDLKYANFAVRFESSSNNIVTHNNLLFNYYGVYLEFSSHNNISDNMISSSYFDGINLDLSPNNTISNNTLSSNLGDGLYLYDSSYNTISNNDVAYNSVDGISIELSTNNTISNNTVSSNGWRGIHLGVSPRNVIKDNEFGPENDKGMEFYQSSYNDLIDNNVTSNDEYGIYISTSSWNNMTGNNIILNNIGVNLEDADKNSIYNNIIQDNTQSFYVITSLGNRIYHNDIILNTVPPVDYTTTNFWNDTYPTGGNYWSEHSPSCDDDHDGTATPQTSGSADGICDSAYELSFNSKDYYPLKEPVRLGRSIVLEGNIEIYNPESNEEIVIGSTELVEGWAYNKEYVPITEITIIVQLRDSYGKILAQSSSTTSQTGYFSTSLSIPPELSPGSYDICTHTEYGEIPDVCVNVILTDGNQGNIFWPALLIPVIVIVIVLVVVIAIVLLTGKKPEPQQFEPYTYGPPPPPPPFPPPPPPP